MLKGRDVNQGSYGFASSRSCTQGIDLRAKHYPGQNKSGSKKILEIHRFVTAEKLGQLQCKPPRAKAARTLSQPEPAVKRPAPYGLSQSMHIGRACQRTTAGVNVTCTGTNLKEQSEKE